MPRRKSIASIDAQICTCKKKIAKAKERYDKLCDELQTLRTEREQAMSPLLSKIDCVIEL